MNFKDYIPIVPDWPKAGVNFLDVTGILENPKVFAQATNWLSLQIKNFSASSIVAVESRGFPFAAVAAKTLSLPLILARKKDKLPGKVYSQTYDTEYSQDTISIKHNSPVGPRPYIVDDILATGGTAVATAKLIRSNWSVKDVGCGVMICLEFLPGRRQLLQQQIHLDTLLNYE